MKAIKIKSKNREEWLVNRNKITIGGSELASILGLNKYQSPLSVYRQKMGIDPKFEGNDATRRGLYFEDAIANMWADETGNVIIKSSEGDMYIHPKHNWLGGSPDRIFFHNGSRKNKDRKVLEIKSTKLKIDVEELPKGWFIQPNFYTGLLGYSGFAIVWFELFTDRLKYQEFDFNKELYDMVLEQVVEWHENHIVKKVPPPPVSEYDLQRLFPQEEPDKMILASDEQEEVYGQLIGLKRQMKALTEQLKESELILKLAMEDAESLIDNSGNVLITYKANKLGTRVFKPREI